MNLAQQTETFANEDQSWLGSAHGTNECETVTIDRALIVGGDITAGFVPAGRVIAKVTATGLYGPYDNAAGDGRETARGHLFTAISTGTAGNPAGALFWHGQVIEAKLPAGHGLDAAAKAELTHIQYT